MAEIKFTIKGNQDDWRGNPIPYHRTTRRSLWTEAGKRYAAWKEYVLVEFTFAYAAYAKRAGIRVPIIGRLSTKEKPMTMVLAIEWADRSHGDPDNVFKGIADAIFEQDKNLDGSFSSAMAKDGHGKVHVIINT